MLFRDKYIIILYLWVTTLSVVSSTQNCKICSYITYKNDHHCSCSHVNNGSLAITCSFKNSDIKRTNEVYVNHNEYTIINPSDLVEHGTTVDVLASFKVCDIISLTINDIFFNATHLSQLPASIVYLDLANTSMNAESVTSLGHLANLTRLSVTGNRNLTSIGVNAISALRRLTRVDLTDNNISYLHPLTFRRLAVLETVDLRRNSLRSISPNTFAAVVRVRLGDNPWDCNCALLWLKWKTADDRLRWDANVTCRYPDRLANRLIRSVDDNDFVCKQLNLNVTQNITVISYLHTRTIHCPLMAVPVPSVYWVTPRGIVASSQMALWFPDHIHDLIANGTIKEELSFRGRPTFYEAKVVALPNGSLLISRLRSYFVGSYTCVAIASDGSTWNTTMAVTITSAVSTYLTSACIIGAFTAYGLSILAMCICLLTICIEKRCLVPKSHVKVLSVTIEPRGYRDAKRMLSASAASLKKKKKASLCGCGLGGDLDRKMSTGGWHIKGATLGGMPPPPPAPPPPPPPPAMLQPLSVRLLGVDDVEGAGPDRSLVGVVLMAAHPRRVELQNEAICQRKVITTVSMPYLRTTLPSGEATPMRRPSTPPEYSGSETPTKHLNNLCVTPAEGTLEIRVESTTSYTRSTLESVSARLEKSMANIKANSSKKLQSVKESSRDYVQSMRDSSEMYATRMKESSSRYMSTILETTGQAAHRMRSGVAHSVEQVKYHMQSMKELCGTGTLIQTISMVSVSTDIDSNVRLEVVKTITFV